MTEPAMDLRWSGEGVDARFAAYVVGMPGCLGHADRVRRLIVLHRTCAGGPAPSPPRGGTRQPASAEMGNRAVMVEPSYVMRGRCARGNGGSRFCARPSLRGENPRIPWERSYRVVVETPARTGAPWPLSRDVHVVCIVPRMFAFAWQRTSCCRDDIADHDPGPLFAYERLRSAFRRYR